MPTKKRITKKQKEILWQAVVDHVWMKIHVEEMTHGKSYLTIPYKRKP